jgi:hypothetical protein
MVIGSIIRFLSVIVVTFILMSPGVLAVIFNLPPGILNSVEILQPEIVLLLLVPVALLFPFASMVISWISQREEPEKPKLTKEEKEAQKLRKKELARRRKEAAKARRERARARRKRRAPEVEKDEWDKALEETYGSS